MRAIIPNQIDSQSYQDDGRACNQPSMESLPKLRDEEDDEVQLLAEALSYTNRSFNGPYATGDELQQ